MKKWVIFSLLVGLSIVTHAQSFPVVRVVTTTPILAEIAQQVGGEWVAVQSLVPLGEDVRTHELSLDDLQTADDADVLLVNGVGLEPFLPDLIANIDTPYWVVSDGMTVIGTARPTRMVTDAQVSVYMTLSNQTSQDLSLITAEGAWFDTAMMHNTTMNGNMASMSHMDDGILVPANRTVDLQPASLHLMLMGVHENLDQGQDYPLTLRFSDGSELDLTVEANEDGIALGTGANAADNGQIVASDAWMLPMQVLLPVENTSKSAYLGALIDDVNCGDNPADTHLVADCNPYVWLDPHNVATWTTAIALIMSDADPEHASQYEANAKAYVAQLMTLDANIQTLIDRVPADQRTLRQPDMFLAYFATRYGIVLEQGSADFEWQMPQSGDTYLDNLLANAIALQAFLNP